MFFVENEASAFWLRTVCLISSCSFLLALQLRSKTALVLFTSMSSFQAHPTLRLGGVQRVHCWSSNPKAPSLSLYLIVSASLSVFSLFVFFVSIFLSRITTTARWQRMATRSKRRDQHGNPEERVVAHQQRKKKTFRAASLGADSQEISLRRIPTCSIMFFDKTLMKMHIDPVFSRGFLMQKVVAPISHNVYKCMPQKINLSDFFEYTFQMNLPMTSINPTLSSPEHHHLSFTCFVMLAFVPESLPRCAHKREYAICRSCSFRAVRRLSLALCSKVLLQCGACVCSSSQCALKVLWTAWSFVFWHSVLRRLLVVNCKPVISSSLGPCVTWFPESVASLSAVCDWLLFV